jgi:ABC-type nitrate/sulfonate/bicarbonate transport system substrate-binding protein
MQNRSTRRGVLLGGGATLAFSVSASRAPKAQAAALKVMIFPGMTNFPVYVAQQNGLFAKYGLAIELLAAPNSTVQRNGLAKGEHQIIHTAADNPVAMVELAKQDAVIVTGGDNGFNHIIVQPDINSLADLRGKTVVVDAPNTAFALLLYKALNSAGLNRGDYNVKPVGGTGQRLNAMKNDRANAAAGIMGMPFNFIAVAAGFKDMGPAIRFVGAYQSDCIAVMRDWAKANSDTLVRYIRVMIEARRWIFDPANRIQAVQLLVDRLKLNPDIAMRSYAAVTHPTEGVAKDARFDMEGFQNVLKLRAEIEGHWGGKPPEAGRYIDLSYYNKALAGL